MSVRKGNKIIAGSYAVVKPEVYTKVETDDLLNQKQDKLIAGNNIFIDENNVISSSGGSGSFINVVQETGDSTEDVMSQASVTYELEQKANTIDLADVSLSGDYEDLSNTPDLSVYTKTEDLAEIAFTADYEDLGNTPDLTLYAKNEELSKVATTNNYNDLDNKPNLELYDTTISVNNKLSLKQDLLTAGEGISIEGNTISSTVNSAEWGNIIGDITNQADLQERLNGKLGIDFDNITEEGVKNLANIIGTGDYMFDTRLVDHELTYEESKGWALQGTYVYKEAVAGSRYGYPDFYNKCVEEFENSTNSRVYLKSNVAPVGTLTDNKGLLSGFSASNYATLPDMPVAQTFEVAFKVQVGSLGSIQSIFDTDDTYGVILRLDTTNKISLHLSSNGTTWNIADKKLGTTIFNVGVDYYVKLSYDGDRYSVLLSTDGELYNEEIVVTSSLGVPITKSYIGVRNASSTISSAWSGTIDLNESYINIDGERWWSGVENLEYKTNPNGHLFYDISAKSKIDELYNTNGIAWYYGIDKENERIFLPRTKWFIQPTGEITEVNTVNEAGLPNIEGVFEVRTPQTGTYSGGFYNAGTVSMNAWAGGSGINSTKFTIGLDASLSNPIYGNSTTVQPPSINQLLYICVGNTNVESAVTDVVDVTTTENDTVPLGYSTYQNGIVPNTSWLKSQGQWNDGNVYTTFYNEFVQKIGQSFASGYVKEITEEYDDYDLVINQTDMTFRLPLLDGSESVPDYSKAETITLPYTAKSNGVIVGFVGRENDYVRILVNDIVVGRSPQGTAGTIYAQVKIGDIVTTSNTTTANGLSFCPTKGNGSLYFKVANAVQNLELLDAGEVLESLADKISRQDCKAYVTETYQNGTSWYRVWSDGWKEQGGKTSHITVAQNQNGGLQINFLKPFKDTNYTPTMSVVNGGDGYASLQPNVINTTQTGMYLNVWGQDGSGIIAFSWYVCGY